MTEEYRNKNKQIIVHYGVSAQLKYFMTEVYELIEASQRSTDLHEFFEMDEDNEKIQRKYIGAEIADVFVFLDQFCSYYEISWDEIYKIAKKKIDRQIERIKKEGE